MVRAGLHFLTSLFLCSESISSRTNILVGPPPLDIDSWFSLLVPDIFSGMCNKFGNLGASGEASGADSKSLAEAILTPLRKMDASTARHLGQSVADLQLILLMEVCRVGSMDYKQKTPGLSRVDLYGPQSAMAPVGETYVRIDDWEGCLERTVMRLSGLLDDMSSKNSEAERSSIPPAKPPRRQAPAGANSISASSSVPLSPRKSSASPLRSAAEVTRGPLETQEILLFCASYVIRSLAWDSPKIREALAGDLLSLFLPILSVYNLLCPRGTSSSPPSPPTTEYGSAPPAPPAPGFMTCFQTRKEAVSE